MRDVGVPCGAEDDAEDEGAQAEDDDELRRAEAEEAVRDDGPACVSHRWRVGGRLVPRTRARTAARTAEQLRAAA